MKQISIPGNADSIDPKRSQSVSKSGITSPVGRDAHDSVPLPTSMSLLGLTLR